MLPNESAPGTRALKFHLSTAQTLSLVTVGVVVAVLTTAMAVVWFTLTQSAVDVAQDRVSRSVKQLVTVVVTGLRQGQARYDAVGHSSAVIAALESQSPAPRGLVDSVRGALARLQVPTDSGLPIELWSAGGKRIAFVGNDVSEKIALRVHPEAGAPAPVLRRGLDSLRQIDSLQLGALYRVGDRTLYWIVLPLVSGGRTLGFLAQQRRIATNSQTEQTIRELSGDSAEGYYRNVDGTEWTSVGGAPAALDASTNGAERLRPGKGRMIYAEERIGRTPLVLVMEEPRTVVVARPATIVRHLILLSGLLTLIGALIAWLAGRRTARPIVKLTRAAEAVASGDYSARVPMRGSEELMRLASSFNHMAGQIGETRSMLENSEAELRTLANAIPQLAWMADADGVVTWFNDRWYEYTGLASSASPSALWVEAHDPATLTEVLRRWRASVQSGDPFAMEVRLRGTDGEYRWFLSRVAPVHDRGDHVSRWFGTSTDIQALREAHDAAEAASRAKSEFLAAMSHELRTPLNAIGGYAELIEMGLRGPVSDEQRRDLARIRSSQAHLLGLISGVLDLSRIESGRVTYNIAALAIDPFLGDLEALVLPQATAKRQTLDYQPGDADTVVLADREKLRQILLNLLSNAIRHSPTGASITIAAAHYDVSTVMITVCDTGPGIPPDRQASIFEPFVQLDRSLTNTAEGVGLGLAISRDLARGMNGDLNVTSTPGEGACFTLTLPAATAGDPIEMARTSELPAARAH